MIEDLREHDGHTRIECDVCIAGGGAAGITVARQLAGQGYAICLLESGGLDFDARTQALAEGPNAGMDYYALVESRLRFLGGTTNIWGGRCVPLDALDFERRAWVPDSGWPLTREALAPWYAAAARDLELGADLGADEAWRDATAQELAFEPALFRTALWRFDEVKERFNASRCGDVLDAPDIRVITHANLCHIQATSGANAVSGLTIRSLSGRSTTVTARYFVLACGGIENARLLLAANDIETQGIGNARDLVGRYFMEHPHGRAGIAEARRGFEVWSAFQRRFHDDGTAAAAVLLPSAALQRERRILNTAVTFKLQRDPARGLSLRKRLYHGIKHQLQPTRRSRRLWHTYRDLRKLLQRTLRKPVERLRFERGGVRVNIMVRGEQAPNPASRVTLATTRDELGLPQARLDWQLSALDKRTVAVIVEQLSAEFERLGHGRIAPGDWLHDASPAWPVDPTVGNHAIAGYHHMGTTRMADSSTQGVVDADCRVHGYDNFYIAGSSVFATSGWANPTLTILALSRRLGQHLAERLRR